MLTRVSDISEEQLSSAESALEQSVMSHIYDFALYPNGDVDLNRDQVLYDHIHKLAGIITPNHKDLRIPKLYQYECPWPSAQMELGLLAAYRTAGDKLRCVVQAAETVMNLLSLAHTTSVPAADDCMPVLIYVLIKVIIYVIWDCGAEFCRADRGLRYRVESAPHTGRKPKSPNF